MDLDLQLGEPGGAVSQSVVPLRLEGLGLLAEGTEEIVTGGDQRTGLGLKVHLHGQLTVAVLREGRSSLSVKGHIISSDPVESELFSGIDPATIREPLQPTRSHLAPAAMSRFHAERSSASTSA